MFIYQLTRQQRTNLNQWLELQWMVQTSVYKKYLDGLMSLNDLRCWSVPEQEKVVDLFLKLADINDLNGYAKYHPYKGYNIGRTFIKN